MGKLITVIFLIFGLAACAGQPSITRFNTPTEPGYSVDRKLDRRQIYEKLILAEIALRRNQPKIAVKHLKQVSAAVNEPKVAERATHAAAYAKDFASAFQAAKRWRELDPESAQALQTTALLAVHLGKDEQALVYLQQILQQPDQDLEQGLQLIAALLGQEKGKRDEAALRLMQQLIDENPQSKESYLAYSNLALRLGKIDIAEQTLSQAMQAEPISERGATAYARVLHLQSKKDEAFKVLENAIAKLPDSEKLRLAYGRMLLEVKDYPKAKEQFLALTAAVPEDSDYLYTLASLEIDMKETEQAAKHLRQLLKLGERTNEAHYYLGRIAEADEKNQQAIAEYELVSRGEYMLDAQIRIAQIDGREGRLKEGLARLHNLRITNPETSVIVRLYTIEAIMLSDAKQYQKAIDVVTDALKHAPGNTDLLYTRGLLYVEVDRIDLLEKDLRSVLLREPQNADALNALGYTLADRTDRFKEAYELISQALKLKPEEAAIIDSMGWVLYRMGHIEEALPYLKKALALQYDNEIAGHLSEVLWAAGMHDQAKTLLNGALEKSPDDETLLQVQKQLNRPSN